MLNRLTINNYALIDSLDIEFPKGLVIITGETGAGKSILLGALSLLLGGKSDASVISDKSRNCIVEAEFSTEGEEYILRRVVSPAGRSRVFVNDEPATIDELKAISTKLIDVHAQHQHLTLSDSTFQMSVLDTFAGIGKKVSDYNSKYNLYLDLKTALADLDRQIAESKKNKDYLEFQYNKLAEANLIPDELESLEQEHLQLSNSGQIKSDLCSVCNLFTTEEYSISSALKEIETLIEANSSYFEDFKSIAERVESARIDLKDIEDEISTKQESVVCSPERLAFVEDRLALLYDLMRKFEVTTVDELIERRNRLALEIDIDADLNNDRTLLVKKMDSLANVCQSMAEEIHKERVENAVKLSEILESSIRSLEMENALFKVDVDYRQQWGRDGIDTVSFKFSANGGLLTDIAKVASGGELSRVMLCIKDLLARYKGMPTMIFDEIDTGVSGRIADKMGALICRMGENMQVFAITHLPQVASKGSAHFLVYKEKDSDDKVKSNIRQIEGEDRICEIAKMLSGSTLTPEALANAKVLIQNSDIKNKE